jgi:hypothetical protein
MTLAIVREYLPDIVIVGGWVPLIYYHYLCSYKEKMPLMTKDIDIVVPERLGIKGNKSLDKLLENAGFHVRFKSTREVPSVSYEGKIGDFEVEIEFLTHMKGEGKEQVVIVQDGLHAQALRYLSILLENAVEVVIDDFLLDDESKMKIKVPTPGAYIFQKGLTFSRRNNEVKKSKDLYYIFDVLSQDSGLFERIIAEFTEFKANYPLKWLKRFTRDINKNFRDINSSGVERVLSQRPRNHLPHLNDDQFRQYVLRTFQDLIVKIESVISAQSVKQDLE